MFEAIWETLLLFIDIYKLQFKAVEYSNLQSFTSAF